MTSAKELLTSAGLSEADQQACFDFFILFSRFEYALKRCGWVHEKEEVTVDWDFTAKKLAPKCDDLIKELRSKNGEIFANPPKKQIRDKNSFGWRAAKLIGIFVDSDETLKGFYFEFS